MSAWRAGISGTKLLEIERGFGVTNLAPSFYFEYLIAESFESLPFSENRTLSRDPLFSQKGDSRGGSPSLVHILVAITLADGRRSTETGAGSGVTSPRCDVAAVITPQATA
jgi:hypothetical protein